MLKKLIVLLLSTSLLTASIDQKPDSSAGNGYSTTKKILIGGAVGSAIAVGAIAAVAAAPIVVGSAAVAAASASVATTGAATIGATATLLAPITLASGCTVGWAAVGTTAAAVSATAAGTVGAGAIGVVAGGAAIGATTALLAPITVGGCTVGWVATGTTAAGAGTIGAAAAAPAVVAVKAGAVKVAYLAAIPVLKVVTPIVDYSWRGIKLTTKSILAVDAYMRPSEAMKLQAEAEVMQGLVKDMEKANQALEAKITSKVIQRITLKRQNEEKFKSSLSEHCKAKRGEFGIPASCEDAASEYARVAGTEDMHKIRVDWQAKNPQPKNIIGCVIS